MTSEWNVHWPIASSRCQICGCTRNQCTTTANTDSISQLGQSTTRKPKRLPVCGSCTQASTLPWPNHVYTTHLVCNKVKRELCHLAVCKCRVVHCPTWYAPVCIKVDHQGFVERKRLGHGLFVAVHPLYITWRVIKQFSWRPHWRQYLHAGQSTPYSQAQRSQQ